MNEIYLSGKIVSVYEPEVPASQPKRLVYQLRVAHKTVQQQVKFEDYAVNIWRNGAVWAASNIRPGMEVLVRGHLSQRRTGVGPVTEVTALQIIPVEVQRIKTEPRSASDAAEGPAMNGDAAAAAKD